MKQNRWRSKVLWTALGGLLVAVFGAFGLYERIGISSEALKNILTAVGAILAAFGVYNNPSDAEKY